ncbi:MAG: ABC transporter permease [Dehalococcoidia bacterium]
MGDLRIYVIRRLALMIPTVFLVTIIVFLTVRLIPGDIVDVMVGEAGAEAGSTMDREGIERALGLDQPVFVQYGRWIRDIVTRGSLGLSLRGNNPVTEKIVERLPVTFELGLLAIVVGLLISLPIGIYSAIRQDTPGDYIGRSLAIIFISVPSFWTGTMIMIYPAIWWGWSPPVKMVAFADDPLGNLGMFIIPSLILGMLLSGTTMRMTRTMMLEVLRQDYIRTAWSKGLKERVVVMRHALKNALIPVVTMVGMQLPILVGGSVIIEQIFNLPGIGRLMLQALYQRDYMVVSGVNLFVAAVVIGMNLVIDLTYSFLDPRVHYR